MTRSTPRTSFLHPAVRARPIPLRLPVFLPGLLLLALFLLMAAPLAAAGAESESIDKRDAVSSRLILPYYEVEVNEVFGTTTLFAVRNESTLETEITISFYEADSPQAPQKVLGPLTLLPKEVQTRNIRDIEALEVDPDDVARGYVVIEVVSGDARISGDYILLTPAEDFATASQLVDGTPESLHSDLCSVFSIRWFRGSFGAESQITLFLDTDTLPADPNTVAYTIYDDFGEEVVTSNLPLSLVSLRVTVDELLGAFDAGGGAVEFQFADGIQGHVAVSIDAFGRFSAGFQGYCKD